MKRVESYEDLPDEIKRLYEELPEREKYRVRMVPWGMGAFAYRFTDEEKESILDPLEDLNEKKEIPAKALLLFLDELEGITSQEKYEILDTPKKADTRAARQKIIDDGETFLKHLKSIVSCRRQWVQYDDLKPGNEYADDDDGRFGDPVIHLKFKVWDLARTIEKPLREMVTALEKFQSDEDKKSGRDRADADNFIRLIADSYSRHIGKPSTYDKGPFFEIVERLYSILDIRGKDGENPKDPTRAIRQALKK